MKPLQLLGIILVCFVANSAYAQNQSHPANWNTMSATEQAAWTSAATPVPLVPASVLRFPNFQEGQRIWVLWVWDRTEWAVMVSRAINVMADGTNWKLNYSYFETLKDCRDAQAWVASLPQRAEIVTFQCFPSEIDPRRNPR